MTKALTLEKRDDNVAVIWFDMPDESVNTLKRSLFDDFENILADIQADNTIEAVVIASGKEDFCVGADVNMLAKVASAQDGAELSHHAQSMMQQIEDFSLPIVAAIHGNCLGGGLELALACRDRIASSAEATKFGFPEVNLGVIPGAGGTQRLPRQIGLEVALTMILTGKTKSAKQAIELGIVSETVPKWILVDVAAERALKLAHKETAIKEGTGLFNANAIRAFLLEDNPAGRKLLFNQARERTLSETHGNMHAPERAIEVIRTGIEDGLAAGFTAEARAFGELAVSSQAQELMYLFFARNELKKENGVDNPKVEAHNVRKVGVLGAGLMGSGIAYITSVEAGLPVRLKDINHEEVRGGLKSIHDILQRRVSQGRMTEREKDTYMLRIHPTTDYSGFGSADVVIEAVIEKLEVKHQVIHELKEHTPDDVIIASNTSSIPIHKIAEPHDKPENVIGMHYFSPVHKIPLLEIIKTDDTAPDVVATCVELGKQQSKTVIVVNDGTGFYTTRILSPYLNEAVHMLMSGIPIEMIDKALINFGFPMGPIRLLDEVGIDTANKITDIMQDAFGERMQAPDGIEKVVNDERLGEKNNRGFYQYNGKHGKEVDESIYDLLDITLIQSPETVDIVPRCVLQMVNEAAYCYGEGILHSARDGDIGAVFGLGFPPFLGGPFRYMDAQGADAIVTQLEEFRSKYGSRFEPAPVLRAAAEDGFKFHSDDAIEAGTFKEEGEVSQ